MLGRSIEVVNMRILITWGSKRGGTEGIARIVGEVLQKQGFEVTMEPASRVRDVRAYDAAVVGGALYANRWHRDAGRFVSRHIAALRGIPVWLFSTGPLDDSADRREIPPTTQVAVLMERLGARGHVTFGGCLPIDAKGFPASAMAKKLTGDWRNPDRIRAWASELGRELPAARPGVAIEHPARSLRRVFAHAVVGWAACAAVLAGLFQVTSTGVAVVLHAISAPLIFTAIAHHYFRARGARDPFPTALTFTATVAVLDAGIVDALVLRSAAMFSSIGGTWLPLALIFLATWTTGLLISTMPWPRTESTAAAPPRELDPPGDHGPRVAGANG